MEEDGFLVFRVFMFSFLGCECKRNGFFSYDGFKETSLAI